MLIRRATPDDAQALCALDARAWSYESAPILSDGKKWLSDDAPIEHTLIAEDASGLVGYATLCPAFPWRIESGRHVGRIQSLCVAPEHRGKRIASDLLMQVDDFARSRGMRKIVLQALATNESAHRVYLRHGFVIEGRVERCFWLEGRWVDDFHFGKWLC